MIEVFSRSMSASTEPVKLVKPLISPAGMPVSRIASRSARGLPDLTSASRLGNTPGYRTGSSPARPGAVTYPANCLSSAGGSEFHRSFLPSGMSTSLTSGLPSRDTCRHGPQFTVSPASASQSVTRWRLAVVHTPMVGCPLIVTAEIGTWIAIECTFRWLVALTPGALGRPGRPNVACRFANGRRSPRSKIEPRST